MNRPVQLALKLAQRLKIQNRKLVAAWVAMLSAVVASFYLGLDWNDTAPPLVLGGETCTSYNSGKIFICEQDGKEYLVVPMNTP